MNKPFFSIIIPTLNEEKYLPKLLKDLSQQGFTDFEIIIVDGNSEDKTIEKAKQFKKKFKISTISVDKKSVSYQRNTGVKKAQSDWLIFMDADNKIPNYFLQGIKYQLEKNADTDYFTCWVNPKDVNLKNRPIIKSLNVFLDVSSKIDPYALGALIGVKKSIFKKIQFDEDVKYAEDSKFVKKLFNANYQFKCFREPQFSYSLRRFEKEGILKLARIVAKAFSNKVIGKEFDESVDYPMLGGSYYEKTDLRFFNKFQSFIKTASKKQLSQAKKLFEYIKEF